jgi:predicted PurR-regulated permease PerM
MPTQKRLQLISFLFLLLVMAGLVFAVVRPFADILVMGFILAVLFRPVFHWFLKRFKDRHTLASLATVVVILIILLVPAALLGKVLLNQALNLYNDFRSGDLVLDKGQVIHALPLQVQDFIETTTQDLNALVSKLTANAFQTFSSVISNLATFIISFFLTMFTVFYFLKDGHHFQEVLIDVSPIDDKQEKILFTKVSNAVNGVVKGQFLTALVQGVVATIGYVIFGVPNFLLWGVFTTLAALVPTVGTALALVPAILYLLITGSVGQAIGLLIWGAVAVGLVDNFIGPKLLGRTTKVHPLLMLIAVLGGVSVFGFLGFLLGPILMAIFVAMIDMYRKDFQAYLDK